METQHSNIISGWKWKISVGQLLPTTNLHILAIVVQPGEDVIGSELPDTKMPWQLSKLLKKCQGTMKL